MACPEVNITKTHQEPGNDGEASRFFRIRFPWPMGPPWPDLGEVLRENHRYAPLGRLPFDYHHPGSVMRSVSSNWRTVRKIRYNEWLW